MAPDTPDRPRSNETFTITRNFEASRALVFKAFTEREHLIQWWGPKGFTMLSAAIDARPGGTFHYGMRAPDGTEMWGKLLFREVAPPERLVFVMSFSDPQGGETRHPWAPEWPVRTLSTITFAEQAGRTIVAMSAIAIDATPREIEVFVAGFASMQQGWGGSLDQLEAHLRATGPA